MTVSDLVSVPLKCSSEVISGTRFSDFDSSGPPLFPFSEIFGGFFNIGPGGAVAIIGLMISHGLSFVRNYWRSGAYRKAYAELEMFRPYGRVTLLHVCIIAEAFGALFFGAPLTLVVLLMLGKTAIDAKVHLMFNGQTYFAKRDRSPGKNAKSKE